MKLEKHVLIFWAIFTCSAFAGETSVPPERVSSICSRLVASLETPAPDIRLELARMPDDAFVDPPPDGYNFDKYIAFKVTINADYNRERIQEVFRRLNAAKWVATKDPKGFTKLRIRVLAPWETWLELWVANHRAAIRVDGAWYEVEPAVINPLLSLFEKAIVL